MKKIYSVTRKSCVRANRMADQRGVALVTALLVVSLATVAAVSMITHQHVDVRRTGNLLHGEQAYAYALAAESWVQVILNRDRQDTDIDMNGESWATALPPIAVEGGLVNGRITDLQGRFNVNNLVGEDGKPSLADKNYFSRLLLVLGLEPALTNALIDWIDPDINASYPDGAEDDTYLLNIPPYRAANRPLVSVSELRLVKGFTASAVAALEPHVTALPVQTSININTATPEVIRALNDGLTEEDALSLVRDRGEDGYLKKADFLAHDALAGLEVDVDIGVASDWFDAQTDVTVGRGSARLHSLMSRVDGSTRVVSRARTRQRLLPLPL